MANKIYKDTDEMTNNYKDERKEAFRELNKFNLKMKKERKKKMIKYIIFIVTIFSLFKLFIGEINLNIPLYYNHRLYEVTLNQQLITVCVDEYRKDPIIPFIINNNYAGLLCFHHDDNGMTTRVFKKGDNIYITINSFECLNSINNGITSCYQNQNPIKRETNDTKYSLLIRQVNREQTIIYDGNFINNITEYFSKKGVYDINMIATHGNVKSVVFFSVKIIE